MMQIKKYAAIVISLMLIFSVYSIAYADTETENAEPEIAVEQTLEIILPEDEADGYVYNGKPVIPGFTVCENGTILTEGTDYIAEFKNNIKAGEASIVVKGIGLYEGKEGAETFLIAKTKNTIKASDITKVTSKEERKIDLEASAKGKAKLSYASSSKKVTVSKSGVVKIPANYVGKATITITSAATDNYKKATKKITVTVKPARVSLKSISNPSNGKLKVTWNKNSKVDGYQIQYSTNSSFKNAKKVTVSDNSVTSKVLTSKISEKSKYYVRIRTFKTVSGTKYYSNWSEKKSLNVTKIKVNVLKQSDIRISLDVPRNGTYNNYARLLVQNDSDLPLTFPSMVSINGYLVYGEEFSVPPGTAYYLSYFRSFGASSRYDSKYYDMYLDQFSEGYVVMEWDGKQYYAEYGTDGITLFYKGNVNGPA